MPVNCVELGFLDRSSTGRTPTASDWSDNVTTAPTSNSFAAVGGLRTFRKDKKGIRDRTPEVRTLYNCELIRVAHMAA